MADETMSENDRYVTWRQFLLFVALTMIPALTVPISVTIFLNAQSDPVSRPEFGQHVNNVGATLREIKDELRNLRRFHEREEARDR
jgi:hypothetical protein